MRTLGGIVDAETRSDIVGDVMSVRRWGGLGCRICQHPSVQQAEKQRKKRRWQRE